MRRLNMTADNGFSPQSPIPTTAQIIESIDMTTYLASLPNGKSIHVHTPKHSPSQHAFQKGDLVMVELKPYDFSRGRINMQKTPASQLGR